ncbi:serine protease gd-like [Lutzomyia longipalpis]|uniref:Putative trypsin-like serine protease n=1 Tax=Lutzomyia longipalpis TaxID=7200 RepID=A0A7G3AX63_LUTLO|nr:serine protease gd-like [Lutzomyia longipalpis]
MNLLISLVILSVAYSVISQRLDHPACQNGFKYVYINSKVGWIGMGWLWTSADSRLHNITLDLEFATAKLEDTTNLGELRILHFHFLRQLNSEKRWNVNYELIFPIQNPLPDMTKLVLNGDVICEAPNLEYTPQKPDLVKLHLEYNDYLKEQRYTGELLRKTTPTAAPPSQQINEEVTQDIQEDDSNSIECGKVDKPNIHVPLVLEGTTIQKGTWPWLVSIYSYSKLRLGFKCGATLVSKKLVITAAHCFFDAYNRKVRIDDVLIILGQYNLKRPHDQGTQIVYPESINVHSNYRKNNNIDSDIAVVVLTEPVRFTTYIRPACLWKEPNTKDSIVGLKGFTAGWGRDENGNFYTELPKQVEIPVVSDEDCINSNKVFSEITSDVTFCAGWRNGTEGPCNGDSGGPLVFQKDGRWTIRGVVSTSLSTDGGNTCNLNEYVVFTDVAKFKDWILSFSDNSYPL